MKCANCDKDAEHVYKIAQDTTILFCDNHLPRFLHERRDAGLLAKTDEHKAALAEGRKAFVPEAAPEPVVEETPKPKAKKTTTASDK